MSHGAEYTPPLVSTRRNTPKDSALVTAIRTGTLSKVEEEIAKSGTSLFDVCTTDIMNTPLMVASGIQGNEPIVAKLLEMGADPHAIDNTGNSCIHHCASKGNFVTAKTLIAAGVDINHANRGGWTPLLLAVKWKQGAIAKVLIEAGADANAKNQWGMTALDIMLQHRTLTGGHMTYLDMVPVRDMLEKITTVELATRTQEAAPPA